MNELKVIPLFPTQDEDINAKLIRQLEQLNETFLSLANSHDKMMKEQPSALHDNAAFHLKHSFEHFLKFKILVKEMAG